MSFPTFMAVFAAYDLEPTTPGLYFYGQGWSFMIRDEGYVQAFQHEPEPSGQEHLVAELEDPTDLDDFLCDTVRA